MKVYLAGQHYYMSEEDVAGMGTGPHNTSKPGDKVFWILGAYLSPESAEKAIRKQMTQSKGMGAFGTRENWFINTYEAE